MRHTNRTQRPSRREQAAEMTRALLAHVWLPAHQPVPSAAPLLRRCRQEAAWGKLSPFTR